MSEQIGPRQFLRQLQAQAPYYVRMLPALPRLAHEYLQRTDDYVSRADLLELIRAQRRTNRLLTAIVAAGAGFLLGLVAMQLLIWIGLNVR